MKAKLATLLGAHQQRPAETSIACLGCDFLSTAVRPEDQQDQFAEHVAFQLATVVAGARADALRTGLVWFSEAAQEAAQKVTPESKPSLAGSYWRGYQAATQEIADLLAEPALAAKVLELPVHTGETPTRVKQWLGRGNRATSSSMAR